MRFANASLTLALISGLCISVAPSALAENCAGAKGTTLAQAPQSPTIVEVAAGAGNFNTLVAALKAADLVDTLAGPGPFTVFAPTDEAFAALPPGTVETLLKPENKKMLVKILTYHVVPGKVTSDQVTSGQVESLAEAMITVTVKDGKVKVNQAEVIKADIDASNGVIHVINEVILPPDA